MFSISGFSEVVIVTRPISAENRNKFNSFSTRISSASMNNGQYKGEISCGNSNIGLLDCAFTYNTLHETSAEAMSDARQLMHDLSVDIT